MTCVDNDQFSKSKDQNKNKKQEQSIHGPKKIEIESGTMKE